LIHSYGLQVLDGQENTLHVAAPPKTYSHVSRGQSTLNSFLQPASSCEGPKTSASAQQPLLDPDLAERTTHVLSSDMFSVPSMMLDGQFYPPPLGENLERNVEHDIHGMPLDNKRKRLF